MSEPAISLRSVTKRFGDVTVLDGISLDVNRGELVCLMGPSGAGKSTVLRTIIGLTAIDAGTILVNGAPVHAAADGALTPELLALRRKVGMVFQQFNLFPHRTALQNVAMAQVHVLGRSRADAEARAREELHRLGLAERADSYPGELSSGQQQRLAICRALALEPEILLLDEVTASLDPESRQAVRTLLEQLGDGGVTRLMVSHDVAWLREHADRIYFAEHGTVVESGSAGRFFDRPRDQRTRSFLSALA